MKLVTDAKSPFWMVRGRIDLPNVCSFFEDESMNDQAQFFVGWGTLSLINAGLAQSKNRSGLLWWLVSLFFGPLATLLIVVLDRVNLNSP